MTNAPRTGFELPQTRDEIAAFLARFDRQVALGTVLLPVDEEDGE